jgi:hypothetical protein
MTLRIIGEGLDAVMFASAMARRGVTFEWLVKNNRFGGYFGGGLDCQGGPIDLGMVSLDPNHYNTPQREISTFRSESGQGARPFIHAAYQILVEMAGGFELIDVKSQDKFGKNTADYFLSDRLFAFGENAREIIGELENRVGWLESHPEWHPRFKLNQDSVLSVTNIADAMIALYGKSLYGLYFKDYLNNCLGELSHSLPATLHRRAWVPLYWPETILEYLLEKNAIEPLFQPVFARFSRMSISEWVFRMIREIESYEKMTFILLDNEPDYRNLNLESENVYAFLDSTKIQTNPNLNTHNPVIGAARMTIVHFCCTAPSALVVFLRDDESGSYRFSLTPAASPGGGKISIEYGESSADLSDEEILRRSIKLCNRNEVAIACAGKIHKGKLPFIAPSTGSDYSNHSTVGNKQTLFSSTATSFNDNIIRAAWAIDHEKRKS